MKDRLKCNAVPIQLPIGKEDTFRGIIDLVDMTADVYYDDMGKDMRVEEIPEDMKELAEDGYRTFVIEAVEENIASNRVIEKNGFQLVGKRADRLSEMKPQVVTINSYRYYVDR